MVKRLKYLDRKSIINAWLANFPVSLDLPLPMISIIICQKK